MTFNEIDKHIEKLRSDALIHSYNFQGYSMQVKNEIANCLEELKITKKALLLACDELKRLSIFASDDDNLWDLPQYSPQYFIERVKNEK